MKTAKLILLLLTAVLIGVCIGFFAQNALLRSRVREYRQISPHMSGHMMGKMTHRLALTERQKEKIQDIIDTYTRRRTEQRALLQMKLHRDITRCLNDEQREEYEKMWGRIENDAPAAGEETETPAKPRTSHAQ